LLEAGLVAAEKKGRSRIYQLRPEGLQEMRRYLESTYRG